MAALSRILTVEGVVAAAAVSVIATAVFCWYQKRRKFKVPTKWDPVGTVTRLYVYPLKSGHEVELETAICTEYGVMMPPIGNLRQLRDRSFLVYNESDKKFETARDNPPLVHIKTAATDDNHVTLAAPNMPILHLKIPNTVDNTSDKIIHRFGEEIQSLDCGDEAAEWISKYLSRPSLKFRIGYHDGSRRRNINSTRQAYKKVYPNFTNDATGFYSDTTSYLLVNQASVDDFNTRIQHSDVTHRNFRPNILIEGAASYAEDSWSWVKIGDVILYTVKPCTRCILTTVNPETGQISKVNEPLRSLRKYRLLKDVKNISLDGNKPLMGLNMGLLEQGSINVGDVVYVGK